MYSPCSTRLFVVMLCAGGDGLLLLHDDTAFAGNALREGKRGIGLLHDHVDFATVASMPCKGGGRGDVLHLHHDDPAFVSNVLRLRRIQVAGPPSSVAPSLGLTLDAHTCGIIVKQRTNIFCYCCKFGRHRPSIFRGDCSSHATVE